MSSDLKMEDAYFVVVAIEKNISATKVEKDFNKLKKFFYFSQG